MKKIALIFAILFIGCDKFDVNKYEIEQDKAGRIIRLNKQTGGIAILIDKKWVKIKNPEESTTEGEDITFLQKPKSWSVIEIPSGKNLNLKASLLTAWRNDKLLYQFKIEPFAKDIYGISINFYDEYGFKIMKEDIRDLSNMVDENGKPIGLNSNSSIMCSIEDYKHSADWDVSWKSEIR